MNYDYTNFEKEYDLIQAHDKFENAGYYFKSPMRRQPNESFLFSL